jgi:hypothetical protein
VFALGAIISGSQQLWILPKPIHGDFVDDREKRLRVESLGNLVRRLQRRSDGAGLKTKYIFALQAPIMLLTFSAMTFLAGVCSVVYSPLAKRLAWNDESKVSPCLARFRQWLIATSRSRWSSQLAASSRLPCSQPRLASSMLYSGPPYRTTLELSFLRKDTTKTKFIAAMSVANAKQQHVIGAPQSCTSTCFMAKLMFAEIHTCAIYSTWRSPIARSRHQVQGLSST